MGVVARIVTGPRDANRCAPDPGLTWDEIDEAGGVIRLSPARSKTLVGRILPISHPMAEALARRRARRDPGSPLVFHLDSIPVRRWRTAWRTACQADAARKLGIRDAQVTGRFQLTSDGHEVYPPAIEEHFGSDIDFAQLVKNYLPARTDGAGLVPTLSQSGIGHSQANFRQSEASAGIDQPYRACQFDCAYAASPVHPSHQQVQQEAGEPKGDG